MSFGANTGMTGKGFNKSTGGGMGGDVIPKGYQQGQLGQFTPEQMQLFQQMFGHVGPQSFLGRLAGGDQSMFEQLEAPAMQQFGQMQSNIANRFSGMGSGARRSSGFGLAQNQAAQDFAGQLQSQRMGLQRQALMDLMGMSESLMGQRPYQKFITEEQTPWWQKLLEGAAGGIGGIVGGAGGSMASKWGANKVNQWMK